MPPVASHKRRIVIAAALVAAAVIAAAFVFLRPRDGSALSPHEISPGMYAYDADGYRYEYHAPTGREGLYELSRDPNCLASVLSDHEDVAKRCREALAKDLDVRTLEELRAKYADEIKRLEALGYL
jgi:hypothetical protein